MTELFSPDGSRKYLNSVEREAFLKAADSFPREVRTFCHLMAFTGCRITEALELTANRVDYANRSIVIRSIKKRRDDVFRSIPVPDQLLDMLDLVHGIRENKIVGQLWPWGRATAWRRIKEVMERAGIHGAQASPKGLRHAFGILAVSRNVPLNQLQKWLGHSQLATTAIYADALGEEERNIASRMW